MNVIEAKRLALSLMAQHGLKDWKFEFNNRKGAYGVCNFSSKTIFLSLPLTQAVPKDAVQNTILHEIAHALVGIEHGHDYVWQRKALEIGCDGQRCNTHEKDETQIRYKYLATCPCCDEKIGASRLPKRKHWHKCNRGFKPENILKYIQQY
jgi:predicted SprT family Zn-dependent metalloprotease